MGLIMVATDFIGQLKGLPVGVDSKYLAQHLHRVSAQTIVGVHVCMDDIKSTGG